MAIKSRTVLHVQNHNQQNIEIFNKNKNIYIHVYYYLAINKVYGKYDKAMSFDAILKRRNE